MSKPRFGSGPPQILWRLADISLHGRAADRRLELVADVRLGAVALHVAEAGGAFAVGAEVVDDGVLAVRVDAGRHPVELQRLPDSPGDVVVGAGGIAADAEPADHAAFVVEGEPAAEHDHAADALADHRIRGRAELRGVAGAGLRRGRARGDEAVERLPGLGA